MAKRKFRFKHNTKYVTLAIAFVVLTSIAILLFVPAGPTAYFKTAKFQLNTSNLSGSNQPPVILKAPVQPKINPPVFAACVGTTTCGEQITPSSCSVAFQNGFDCLIETNTTCTPASNQIDCSLITDANDCQNIHGCEWQ